MQGGDTLPYSQTHVSVMAGIAAGREAAPAGADPGTDGEVPVLVLPPRSRASL